MKLLLSLLLVGAVLMVACSAQQPHQKQRQQQKQQNSRLELSPVSLAKHFKNGPAEIAARMGAQRARGRPVPPSSNTRFMRADPREQAGSMERMPLLASRGRARGVAKAAPPSSKIVRKAAKIVTRHTSPLASRIHSLSQQQHPPVRKFSHFGERRQRQQQRLVTGRTSGIHRRDFPVLARQMKMKERKNLNEDAKHQALREKAQEEALRQKKSEENSRQLRNSKNNNNKENDPQQGNQRAQRAIKKLDRQVMKNALKPHQLLTNLNPMAKNAQRQKADQRKAQKQVGLQHHPILNHQQAFFRSHIHQVSKGRNQGRHNRVRNHPFSPKKNTLHPKMWEHVKQLQQRQKRVAKRRKNLLSKQHLRKARKQAKANKQASTVKKATENSDGMGIFVVKIKNEGGDTSALPALISNWKNQITDKKVMLKPTTANKIMLFIPSADAEATLSQVRAFPNVLSVTRRNIKTPTAQTSRKHRRFSSRKPAKISNRRMKREQRKAHMLAKKNSPAGQQQPLVHIKSRRKLRRHQRKNWSKKEVRQVQQRQLRKQGSQQHNKQHPLQHKGQMRRHLKFSGRGKRNQRGVKK